MEHNQVYQHIHNRSPSSRWKKGGEERERKEGTKGQKLCLKKQWEKTYQIWRKTFVYTSKAQKLSKHHKQDKIKENYN